jgi:hypothetical protein
VSNWKIGTYPFSKTALLEGDKYIGTMDEPEKAQRVAALLNERDALRAALMAFKNDYAEDGCYCSSIIGTGKCAICMADAALEQPAAQSSERAE